MITIEEFREFKKEYRFAEFLKIPSVYPTFMQQRFFRELDKNEQYFLFGEFEKQLQPFMDLFYYEKFGCRPDRTVASMENDVQLTTARGKKFYVEEKYRTKDWQDLTIELIQDIRYPLEKKDLGWFYNEQAHRLVYVVCRSFNSVSPSKIYTVDLPALRRFMPALVSKLNIQPVLSKKGRGVTLNVALKWEDLKLVELDGGKTIVTEFLEGRDFSKGGEIN